MNHPAHHRTSSRWLSVAVAGASLALVNVQAQSLCDVRAAAAHEYLGRGVALYEAKDFRAAERALQAALFAGLTRPSDQGLAHKLLAFTYCTAGERKRCSEAFSDALTAQPDFALAGYEARNPVWSASYQEARKRQSVATQRAAVGTAAPMPRPASMRATSDDSNVRLRVEPWASVQVNGKNVGVTPPVTRLKLPPGKHTIRLSNPGFEPVRQTIHVARDRSVTVQHDYESQ
jgi:hypothetical protein